MNNTRLNDPLFPLQWHLDNRGQSGGTVGEDLNILDAWSLATGDGVVIGIVDDGLQYTHPDLVDRYLANLSYDFANDDSDPSPNNNQFHGTAVAGIAAAQGNNEIGITGVAYNAGLAGLQVSNGIFNPANIDTELAAALSYKNQDIDIYNNSWELSRPVPLGQATATAIQEGVENGRGGLGSIYVFGSGNDGVTRGNVNYNAFANSRYTIAVGEIDGNGVKTPSSNPGASLLVSAYGGDGIVTTDLQGEAGLNLDLPDLPLNNDYTQLSGTSAATPIVSGTIALMLEANPNLTWRDVQHILVGTAKRNDPDHPDWIYNSAGFLINHDYGFGAIDAEAAVSVARDWQPLAPQVSHFTGNLFNGRHELDDSKDNDPETPFTDYYSDSVEEDINIEWVEVVITPIEGEQNVLNDALDKDIELILTSPTGTQSILSQNPAVPVSDTIANNWTFTTARHWGESSQGSWTLTTNNSGSTAEDLDYPTKRFNWELRFYGVEDPLTPATQIQNGIEQGREGLGNIYVFGSGDEGDTGGNVNYDPLINSRYTIAVGEIDANGVKIPSSNPGASLLLVSADGSDDLSGTMAAADTVSDVTDLMLEANPHLTWRDVQYILVVTATQNDPDHPDWIHNGGGYLVNHDYGFGAIDAEAAVNVARNWQPLAPGVSHFTGNLETTSTSSSGKDNDPETPFAKDYSASVEEDINIEWLEVVITPTHVFEFSNLINSDLDQLAPGIELILTSPTGTQSILSQNPTDSAFNHPLNSWTFTTARHWGESSEGKWTITTINNRSTAEDFQDPTKNFNWELKFYGADYPTSINSIDFIAPNTPTVDIDDVLGSDDDTISEEEDLTIASNTVYRFFNANAGVHFYTANEVEREAVQELPNFNFEGASYLSADSLTGQPVPVYRFLNQDTGVHLYTTSEVERDATQQLDNFSFEGEAFFAYPSEVDGSIPIFRFFNTSTGAHFYTPSAVERDAVLDLPDFQAEGIAYHALPLAE